ncbi:pyridoxal phosphate-dependent aminotransferase [Methanobrevibacter sp. TMH8]|uniref:pyridoxal phosphate-dependent aminotransferase n=1 Tax=Methanobrevibacter sp. TMH8 TaxID=2848611 RepID=UPI001CCEF321|nr:pyridoxal phosphate-dependent aminotransferase [Methanobrevibacter sp. TMH8]MBZ9570782.1 pyridoxal phosphate-dependent aminotransferase [Methanobrevibacter sp. TMH8]
MIQPKKYAKAAKIPPKGFKSANEFFEEVFNDKEMIWMGQNTNHLHESNEILDAMISCVESREYCKYPPPEGFKELKNLILEDLSLEDKDILITAGGTESLYLCMNDILEPNNNVITCDPGYLIIDNFASRFSNEVISVPIYSSDNDYKLTPELVKEYMNENTKIIVLIDPLNPLGSSYNEEEIKEFAEIAIENDIYLLHDITYRDFAKEHFLAAHYAPNHTITIYSFSKIFGMAGLRIGSIISTKEIISSVRTILINDLGTNLIAQAGAIAALKSKDSWINEITNTTRNNQKLIKECVDEIKGVFIPVYPSNGNMLAIDLKNTGIDPKVMADYLLKKKIFTRQGAYTSNLFGDKYLRVSFSIPEEQVKIFVKEFKSAVDVLRK